MFDNRQKNCVILHDLSDLVCKRWYSRDSNRPRPSCPANLHDHDHGNCKGGHDHAHTSKSNEKNVYKKDKKDSKKKYKHEIILCEFDDCE